MNEPFLADDALLHDIGVGTLGQPLDSLFLWWLGQSGFVVRWQGRHALLDPYLSDSLTRKYAATDKPHVQMTRHVIEPARLGFANVVSSSHNHTDHLDADTLMPLIAARPAVKLVVPEANRAFVAHRVQADPDTLIGVDDGSTVEAGGFTFTGIASAHETVERDSAGHCRFLGYIARVGDWTIYHSGDTVLYDGMVEKLRPFKIDVALLPINGRSPQRRVAGNLWGREAAWLAREIGARMVIPCHYDMFEFNTATPDEFVNECQRLGQPYRVLRPGERWSSTELPPRV